MSDPAPVDVNGVAVLALPFDSTDQRAQIRYLAETRGSSALWARSNVVLDQHGRVLKAKAGISDSVTRWR